MCIRDRCCEAFDQDGVQNEKVWPVQKKWRLNVFHYRTEVEEFIKMAEPQNGMIDYKGLV